MAERDPIKHIIGTCAAQIGAMTTPILSPLIIGGLIVGLDLGEVEAGSLITAELLVVGITSMLMAPLVARFPHHILAISGALLLVVAQYLSGKTSGLSELYTWRILAGVAGGCLMATANAAIAQAKSYTLLYGLAWAGGYSATAVLAISITAIYDPVSYETVYTWLALCIAIAIPFMWLLPRHGKSDSAQGLPSGTWVPAMLLMTGIMLIGISMMAYYAFVERIAVNINASSAQSGQIIAAVQVAGIIGGLLAAPVASRLGVLRALVSVSVLHALVIMLAVFTDTVLILGMAAFVEAIFFIIMVPLMYSLAAQIDLKGRWAAVAGGVFTLSTAFGPIIGGLLIENISYNALAWLQPVATLPAIILFLQVNRTASCGENDGPGKTGSTA